MKALTFVLITLISCYFVVAVHRCYKYTGTVEKFEPNEGLAEECDWKNGPYLCESRQTEGQFEKKCIKNSPETIKDCDQQNSNKTGTYCYHCDRELCNSGEISSISLMMALMMVFMVMRFT